jgi:ATP-binding cassette subfamily B protein
VQGTGSVPGALAGVVDSIVSFVATAALIVYLDWRLAMIGLALLPIFVLPTRGAGRQRKTLRRAAQARMAELTGILMETLSVSGAHMIRLFGTEAFERERLGAKGDEVIDLSLKQTLAGRRFQLVMGLFEALGPALIFAVGGYFILVGQTRAIGSLVAFVTALKRLYGPATALAGVHVDLVTSYAYFERVFRVLDLEPATAGAPDAIRLPSVSGSIVLDRVSLTFPDGQRGLHDVSMRIEAGQSVALVGRSGSGKTTLAGLIPRLDDPTIGRVLLDGYDLRCLDVKWLRSHIGVVTQETFLFHASILDNLRYGRPNASLAEVEGAARAACIHDMIASLPQGYDTLVGNRGHRLSGGERQRIAIARVMLKDPQILILDEATSSLDSTNEALIQTALETLRRGRTSVIIAHRLSTVRQADQILVLDGGMVVERGTHESLLAEHGRYAVLHAEQFSRRTTDRLIMPASVIVA